VITTAEQMIALLQQSSAYASDAGVQSAYAALMGQLAAQLVGEPFEDGEITEAEWVLLQYSLRQFSLSPRGAAAWNAMRRQANALEAALKQAETARAAAPQAEAAAKSPRRLFGQFRPAWLSALTRQRQPDVRTVTQTIGDIQGSQNVTITGMQIGNVLEVSDDPEEEDTAPVQAELPVGLPFVFLSYSRRNARIMRRLRADLTAAGFTVWTDENLQPGTPQWMSAIETAIRSAMCAIVLLTPDAKKSEWVEKELATAKIHHKEIIPLLALGNEQTAVPLLLSSTQYLDIRSDADYRRALRSLTPVLRNLQRGVAVRA
jgi:hypothetical protein